jgi:3-carboxy-cis,cis-muconate cycloisomerase
MASVFSPETHVRHMLAFEAALARAEANAGVIPREAAHSIAAACRSGAFDVEAIYREAAVAGTPAIPLVRMLTQQVSAEGRGYVHWGATSQDAIDTATVLQMREGLALLEADLLRLGTACANLADGHRDTLMAGRTLLQQALPIPFGLKAARWLGLVVRQLEALRGVQSRLTLQFGGAAGTLAALGDRGLEVAELLAAELELPLPDLPWHAERDRVATIATTLGVTAGAMAKIAQDVVLMAQSEVAEVSEMHEPGKGGSSTLPHKHNPVDATLALASARLAIGQVPVVLMGMMQEHERGAGGWQAEWDAVPSLFRFTAGAVSRVTNAASGLQIDVHRMRLNLESGGDMLMAEALAMALAPRLGRTEAQHLVQAACLHAAERDQSLQQAALEDVHICTVLSPQAIEIALNPTHYLGSADLLINRALQRHASLVSRRM